MRKNRYQLYVINVDKLRKDVTVYCEKKGILLKDFYESIGMANNILSNSSANATRNSSGFDFTKYEDCENYGLMQKTYLSAICSTARLNAEDYICKEKEPTKKLNSISAKDLVERNYPGEKIDEIITQLEKLNGIQENILNDVVICISNLASRVNNITTLIESIGRVQAKNMEYLKEIKDGIDKLNDKWK